MFLHPPPGRAGAPSPAPNYAGAEFAAQEAADRDPKNEEARAILREARGIRKVSIDALAGGAPERSGCEVFARKILDGQGALSPEI